MSDDEEFQRLLEMKQAILAQLKDGVVSEISESENSSSSDIEDDTPENSTDIKDSPQIIHELDEETYQQSIYAETTENVSPELAENSESVHVKNEIDSTDDDEMDSNSDISDVREREIGMDIDEMLEKPLDNEENGEAPNIKKRRVLEFRGTDHFDVLPDGWVEITHSSGLPVYLHRTSRVCTFGRPYFIGPGSSRHHHVPESAIPCYFQKKVLKQVEEQEKKELSNENGAAAANSNGSCPFGNENNVLNKLQAPSIKVQTSEDFKNSQLDPDALYEYAKGAFRFKTITYRRFTKWPEARYFYKNQKRLNIDRANFLGDTKRPGLPNNFQLITVPVLDNTSKPQQKNFYLNPVGKTSVNVLHEYVQKVLKSTVNYEYTDTRSCATPYKCIAKLNNPTQASARLLFEKSSIKEKLMLLQDRDRQEKSKAEGEIAEEEEVILGEGCGSSKKCAKLNAARDALKILIPTIEFNDDGFAVCQKSGDDDNADDVADIFRLLPIEDSRIPDLCSRAGQPMPFLILSECLKRNNTLGDTNISMETKRIKHQRHEFIMVVGKHEVKVVCTNKRDGKQKAAQAMLKKLHPNYDSWGSILQLYGYKAQQKHKEAIKSKKSVIQLQTAQKQADESLSNSLEPNTIILDKLRSEMHQLVQSSGVRPEDLDFKSQSVAEEAQHNQGSSNCPELEFIPLDL
uniref:DRBM domain-containing protein n=1 Tax=Acrobeloides nanus TaxID=290746 RepID=A0A914CES2_9BILA